MRVKKLAKLKYNIWFYFILFSLVIVLLTWIFQILLFDSVYQQKRYDTLVATGEQLSSALNTDAEINDEIVTGWLSLAVDANEAGIFTYLAKYDDESNLAVQPFLSGYISTYRKDEGEKPLDPPGGNKPSSSDSSSYSSDLSSQGKIITPPTDESIVEEAIDELVKSNQEYVCSRHDEAGTEYGYYFYATRIKNNQIGEGYLILKCSQQTLAEAVKVIQLQLIIVTVVVIVLSFFISMYIATRLSEPIDKMSKTATAWANGDDNVTFSGDNYEELDELANALNYAKDGIAQTGVLQRDLLANVSHDLKTPLTMIKAYAEMIRDLSGDIKEKRDVHTQVIIDEADRLAMLVNDILDLSKLQNGMNSLDIKSVNLSELCETVIYRFKEFVNINGFTISTDIDPDLFTMCDEQKIEQVIYNLVGNSINYTGEDKTIYVRLKKDGNVIRFETIDTGKGISEDKLSTIWEKYYRYSETHQRPIKGTGLGLSIVKTILEAHNLRFGVISKKDVGSNFFIEFKYSNE